MRVPRIQRFAAVGLALTLAGCSEWGKSTPFYTSTGVLPQMTSGPATSTPDSTGSPVQAAKHNGSYRGTATLISGGGCMGKQNIVGFHVHGNRAQWAGFGGTIDSAGGVQMHLGQEWLVGQFEEDKFAGQLEIDKWSGHRSCAYVFALERVGP
jgi:hypothetical protein